jgi:hypothetical protein
MDGNWKAKKIAFHFHLTNFKISNFEIFLNRNIYRKKFLVNRKSKTYKSEQITLAILK